MVTLGKRPDTMRRDMLAASQALTSNDPLPKNQSDAVLSHIRISRASQTASSIEFRSKGPLHSVKNIDTDFHLVRRGLHLSCSKSF